MQLLTLTVENIGLFHGVHRFDLSTGQDGANPKNLVLFVGHNGAGKSTLFQSFSLALYGLASLGDRVSQQQYNEHVQNRLHRRSLGNVPIISNRGSVAVAFEYVLSNRPVRVQVERSWTRHGRSVEEVLDVYENGKKIDAEVGDYQAWVNQLVPPGFWPLCFFDAENLDSLASTDQQNGLLKETVYRLLGLDLVKRLHADLDYHTLRQGGTGKAQHLREMVLQHQAAIDALDAELADLSAQSEALLSEQFSLEVAVKEQERRLAAEGGLYAARRAISQERLETINNERVVLSSQMESQISHLLPFALAPRLCSRLSESLSQEADRHRQHLVQTLWQERVAHVAQILEGPDFWQDTPLSSPKRRNIKERFLALIKPGEEFEATTGDFVHHLAEPEHERLQSWISQVLHTVPDQVQQLGDQLRKLEQEQHRLEVDLRRVPSDEILAPIHDQISQLDDALQRTQKQSSGLREQIGATQYQRTEQARQMQRGIEQLTEVQANEQQLVLAERSKVVLRVYEDALLRQRLTALEQVLVENFNTICQKEHLLKTVAINPEDCSIQLQTVDGRSLRLSQFSAGERQLYALALLQALRQISKRPLPLAVDTPLARLDDVHRHRFLHDYIPTASEQVLLFATNAEINDEMLHQVQPYLSRSYHLQFDSGTEETNVILSENGQTFFSSEGTQKEVAHGL